MLLAARQEGLVLDPVYEAKCLPYLEPGDVLWTVGVRASALPGVQTAGPSRDWLGIVATPVLPQPAAPPRPRASPIGPCEAGEPRRAALSRP